MRIELPQYLAVLSIAFVRDMMLSMLASEEGG
jgi:hypothetical protein